MENAVPSPADRLKVAPRPMAARTARSRVTNGRLLAGVDQRSSTFRRFRDLVADLTLEQGRELSISETGLIKSAAALLVRSEELQAAAVRGDAINGDELIRLTSEARRLLSSLRKPAVRREPEQPTLAAYLREQYGEGAPALDGAQPTAQSREEAAEEPSAGKRTSEAASGSTEAA